jgi:tetratricopeptide (TPR) repeat protein
VVAVRVSLAFIILLAVSCSRDPQKAKAKYFAAGQNYMEKGQYGDAAIEFRNALRLDPRFVEAYYQLARVDLAQKNWGAAYASLDKAIELDPSRIDARLDRGRLYLAAKQYSLAKDEATFIVSHDPKNVGAYQLLGSSLLGEQKYEEALAAFLKATGLLPNDSSTYLSMAVIESKLQRPADAEQYFKKALALDPKATQAYIALAGFYRMEGRGADAQQVLQTSIDKNPEAVEPYIELASIIDSQSGTAGADTVLEKLRERLPGSADAAIAIGDFYAKRNKFDQALAEYKRGLISSPKDLEIEKQIQDVYLQTNQIRLAADLDRDLMALAPKDVMVRVYHGRLLLAQGKFPNAIIELQRVAADAADSAQARYFLAMAYWQNSEVAQANNTLQDALKLSPGLPVVLQALVRINLAQSNPSNARNYAQQLVDEQPSDPGNRLLLADALSHQGLYQPEMEQLVIAQRLAPKDATIHLSMAEAFSTQKKFAEAQKEFEAAFQNDPRNTAILGRWALFLVSRNEASEALSRVQQYVSANPANPYGYVLLGGLNADLKNYSSAQAELEQAIRIDPKNVEAYLQLGKVYQAQGQLDLAIARYQTAIDLQPKLASLSTMIGNLYLDKGDLETARKYYTKVLQADPNAAIANANLAWVDAQEGKDLDVALGMAQKAKSLMPDLPAITDTLAWILYKKGNYAGAIPLLQDCVQKSPNSPDFHYHLGMTLVAAGQHLKGKDQLQAALRLNLPGSDAEQAHRALAQSN